LRRWIFGRLVWICSRPIIATVVARAVLLTIGIIARLFRFIALAAVIVTVAIPAVATAVPVVAAVPFAVVPLALSPGIPGTIGSGVG
jgi:hypothetical protein